MIFFIILFRSFLIYRMSKPRTAIYWSFSLVTPYNNWIIVVALMNGYNCFIGRGAQRQAERYAPIKIVFGKHLDFLRESVICFMLKTPYSGTFVKSPRQKWKRLHRKVKSRKTCSETKNAHSYPNTAGSLYAKRIFAAGGKYANRFCAGSTPSYAQRLSHIYFRMIYRIRLYCKHSRFFGGLVYFSAHYPLPTPARRRIVNAAAIQKKQSERHSAFL